MQLLVIALRHERLKLTFGRSFSIKGIARPLPPGDYELVPDHELIGEPYFPVYRRIITLISVPPQPYRRSSVVKANVRLADILASHRLDQIGAAATDRVVIQTASKDFHGR